MASETVHLLPSPTSLKKMFDGAVWQDDNDGFYSCGKLAVQERHNFY
jgi:hypothetical protein